MKRIRKNMLSQEMKETKQGGVTKEFDVKQVKGKHQCHIIQNICGEIKLAGAPYFSLVLDNGSDIIPLISVDSPHHLADWMSFVGQNVMIKELMIISESFQKYNSSTEHKNYLVKRENVILLGSKDIECRNKNNILEIDRSNIKEKKRNNIIRSQRTCRIVVHHVSTPFHITEDTSYYCLALISYTNNNNLVVIIWLVLREEQVAWREFMVPNREYLLHFPPETDKFFFDSAKKPLDTIMEKNIREIRVMFHHKMLFSRHGMLNGSIVPPGSKLYLSQNTSLSECIYRFTVDLLWFRHWFSTSEADHASVPLVTFYGKVTSIKYLEEEEVYQSCYLCIHKNPREPVLRSPKTFHNKVWIDPFQSGLVIEEEQLIELPSVTNIEKSRMKTGVPGELVQLITLEDLFTGEERSVYIKHSFVSNYQQMVRLAAGVTVCISHLNRRCSKTGKYYYLATMLSCCRVLDYTICSDYNEGWGMYGLCHKKGDDQVKMWGVLEPFSIAKVGIRAKCNYCRALFFKKNCSNSCGGIGTYSTSAHAIAWINVIQENKRITKEKVIIKDDLVRKLLNIPEEYWEVLQELAALEEIVAFRYQALNDDSDISPLRKSFQRYCFVKSREKFYISMKKLPNQDEGRLYFCLSLEPVNKERLDLVAGLVELST